MKNFRARFKYAGIVENHVYFDSAFSNRRVVQFANFLNFINFQNIWVLVLKVDGFKSIGIIMIYFLFGWFICFFYIHHLAILGLDCRIKPIFYINRWMQGLSAWQNMPTDGRIAFRGLIWLFSPLYCPIRYTYVIFKCILIALYHMMIAILHCTKTFAPRKKTINFNNTLLNCEDTIKDVGQFLDQLERKNV